MKLLFGKQDGFSLMELMITLGVAGVLLAVAFPNFTQMIQGQRLKTQTNDTLAAIIYAKSEALKRRSTVTVCAMKTNVDNQCGSSVVSGPMAGLFSMMLMVMVLSVLMMKYYEVVVTIKSLSLWGLSPVLYLMVKESLTQVAILSFVMTRRRVTRCVVFQ